MPPSKARFDDTLQDLLGSVVANAPIVLFAFDAEGVFTHCEGRGLEALGRRAGDSVGKSVFDVYAEHPAVIECCRRALKGETFTAIVPVGEVTFEARYTPRLDWGGKVTGVLGVATDVSESYRAAVAKDEFLSVVSHELRTPLSSASGWAYMLREGELDAAQSKTAVETIVRNLEEMKRLICELRDASHAATGALRLKTKRTDIGAAVREAVKSLASAAAAKNQRLAVSAPSLTAPADKTRVRQIAWILASNAVKYSPKGSAIDVRLERRGDEAVLTVADEGPGIPVALRGSLFDLARPSAPGQPARSRGLGLGLSIARRLAELHGGGIFFSDAADAGAVFTVRLPLEPQK